jgi:hypothetical protein
MVGLRAFLSLRSAILLALLPLVLAFPHGEEHGTAPVAQGGMESMNMNSPNSSSTAYSESFNTPSYFRYSSHGGWMYGHILAMVVSWAILLPLSK